MTGNVIIKLTYNNFFINLLSDSGNTLKTYNLGLFLRKRNKEVVFKFFYYQKLLEQVFFFAQRKKIGNLTITFLGLKKKYIRRKLVEAIKGFRSCKINKITYALKFPFNGCFDKKLRRKKHKKIKKLYF